MLHDWATNADCNVHADLSVEFAEEADHLQSYLSSHTGFFEDIRLWLLILVEGSVNRLRIGIKRLAAAIRDGSVFSLLGMCLFVVRVFFLFFLFCFFAAAPGC